VEPKVYVNTPAAKVALVSVGAGAHEALPLTLGALAPDKITVMSEGMVILGFTSNDVVTELLSEKVNVSPLVGEIMLEPFHTPPTSIQVRVASAGVKLVVTSIVPPAMLCKENRLRKTKNQPHRAARNHTSIRSHHALGPYHSAIFMAHGPQARIFDQ
jgi:hypothetical protein